LEVVSIPRRLCRYRSQNRAATPAIKKIADNLTPDGGEISPIRGEEWADQVISDLRSELVDWWAGWDLNP